MNVLCEFCKSSVRDKYSLKTHLSKNKKCLEIRGLTLETKFVCKGCQHVFPNNINLVVHIESCKQYIIIKVREECKDEYKNEIIKMQQEIINKDKALSDAQSQIDKLQKIIENIATKAIDNRTTNNYQSIDDEIDDNSTIIEEKSDGMINATALHKAAEKRLDHYKENLHELSSVTGSPVSGKQPDEIDNEYKKQITDLKTTLNTNKEQYQKLLIKHNSSLKTHRYIKFKKTDPCFYIIDSGINCDCLCYKFGITGLDQDNNIDDRLRCHRTLWPKLKVRYLLFIKDVEMIEKNFKMMFEKEINPNGHEIIEGVPFNEMIKRIEKLFDILCIKEYHIMSEEKLKEYNDYVNTTIKVF